MERLISALVKKIAVSDYKMLRSIMSNAHYDFNLLKDVLGGFNYSVDDDRELFDFNFESLNGTIYRKKGFDKAALGAVLDVWVGDYSSPIASVFLNEKEDGEIDYLEMDCISPKEFENK